MERCTKFQPFGEYNKDLEVSFGFTSLQPNFASSIGKNKEVGKTSHTRERWLTFIFINMQTREETKSFLEKKYPEIMNSTGKNWDVKDDKLKERVLERLTDYFHPIIVKNLKSIENTLGRVNQRRENFTFLFIGALLGVVGGLVANILHDLLIRFSLKYYIIIASIIFLAVLLSSLLYINYKK
ncbi:MAG: hypothetical protein U5L76_01360 [Patescibacteria group bacterium]|nr:hypothetical protein [Patescibacteria group bacterium]